MVGKHSCQRPDSMYVRHRFRPPTVSVRDSYFFVFQSVKTMLSLQAVYKSRPGLDLAHRPQFATSAVVNCLPCHIARSSRHWREKEKPQSYFKGARMTMKDKLRWPKNNPPGCPGWAVVILLSPHPMVHFSFWTLRWQRVIHNWTFWKIIHTQAQI